MKEIVELSDRALAEYIPKENKVYIDTNYNEYVGLIKEDAEKILKMFEAKDESK